MVTEPIRLTETTARVLVGLLAANLVAAGLAASWAWRAYDMSETASYSAASARYSIDPLLGRLDSIDAAISKNCGSPDKQPPWPPAFLR